MKKLFALMMMFCTMVFAQLTPVDSTITGHITADRVLSASKRYLLSGFVYVDSTYKLTIPAGTVILGEKSTKGALIIKRGAKIIAQGTATNPIIFTSQQPAGLRAAGDWGGIIICGSAPNNQSTNVVIEGGVDAYYGGSNSADSSGVLCYVRIEFPGVPFQPNNEINGLTCGSVGSKTKIDHVMVSYSGDDAFEFFGGSVNCSHLIAYKTLDDDFDTDFGYSGKLQFGVSVRDPFIADQSRSESFESDNDAGGSWNNPRTTAVFSNFTLVGPKQNNSDVVNSLHFYAVHHRRSSKMSIFNSLFLGYNAGGIYLDGANVTSAAAADSFRYMNNIFAGCAKKCSTNVSGFNVFSWFNTSAYANDSLLNASDLLLKNPYNQLNPNFTPQAGSPAINKASFTYVTDPFFTAVTYAGAFDPNGSRWDAGWSNYDPQSKVWNSALSWTSNIKVKNSLGESRYASFGRGTGATDGIDAAFGEIAIPPANSEDVDARFILPVTSTEVALDIRNTGAVSGNRVIYALQVQGGTAASGSTVISWDPNLLGAGTFYISDSVYSGAFFPLTNMKTASSVSVPTGGPWIVYIYVYTKFSFTQTLGNGWNMVSFPGTHPNSMSADTLFRGRTAGVQLYSWNGAYTGTTTVTPGVAYWLKMDAAKNIVWNGLVQSSVLYPQIDFSPRTPVNTTIGWNMFGVYDYDVDPSRVKTIPSNSISGLPFEYSPASGYTTAGFLTAGKGYWINVTASGQLVVPGPNSAFDKSLGQPVSIVKEGWGKILLSDASGKQYTLYLADSDVTDYSFAALPPAPPAGMFDVRFGSDRFVENRNISQTVKLSGVTYPVALSAKGVSLAVKTVNGNMVIADGMTQNILSGSEFVIESVNAKPVNFELAQNYPNPFNPSTTIKFAVPQASHVRISIYNNLGQNIATLIDGNYEAGSHSISWNAGAYASGLYFCKMEAGSFVTINKMLLMK